MEIPADVAHVFSQRGVWSVHIFSLVSVNAWNMCAHVLVSISVFNSLKHIFRNGTIIPCLTFKTIYLFFYMNVYTFLSLPAPHACRTWENSAGGISSSWTWIGNSCELSCGYCHVDTGNKTQVLLKTSECSKLLSYPSSILIRPVQLFEQLFSIVTKAGDIAHAQDSGFTHCPINK